ncbi:MAG: hypothetical protein Q8R96_04025 [Bacteroidota bacterium]|nr:hypothetical protein [Bacteroidota bacterium]
MFDTNEFENLHLNQLFSTLIFHALSFFATMQFSVIPPAFSVAFILAILVPIPHVLAIRIASFG